jgi:hypothetical protein
VHRRALPMVVEWWAPPPMASMRVVPRGPPRAGAATADGEALEHHHGGPDEVRGGGE